MYNSTESSIIRKTWISEQIRTAWHILSIFIFAGLSVMEPLVILGALVLISVIIAISKIPSLFIITIIVTAVSLIFPPLGALIGILFFILKINYVIQHLLPLSLGLFLIVYLFTMSMLVPYPSLRIFVISAVIFHIILVNLYKREYSSAEAIQIMASVPLYILIIILPIILDQLDEMDDLFDGNHYDQYVAENENGYVIRPEAMLTENQDDPGTHLVQSHLRKNSDGTMSVVREHIRSNPDGFKGNNLSK